MANQPKLVNAIDSLGKWTIEIVKRSDTAKGFEVIPRHRIVERTSAEPQSAVSQEFEASIENTTARLRSACIKPLSCSPFQAVGMKIPWLALASVMAE